MARLNLNAVKKPLFSTQIKPYIGHINAGNHLGHDSMVMLLQEARERFFQSHHVSELNYEGCGIMIVNLAIEYLQETVYGDELSISLGLGKVGTSSFEFEYQVFNQQHVELARALTTSVFCDAVSRKSVPIPKNILHLFRC